MFRRRSLCGASTLVLCAALAAVSSAANAQTPDQVLPPVTVEAPREVRAKPAVRKPQVRSAAVRRRAQPRIAALTSVVASRRPRAGYAARILMFASVGALSGVFVSEMLLGRFIAAGANQEAAITLFNVFQSPAVFAALVPGLLAFFVGTALAVFALASSAGPFRWPALALGLGATLIMGEIILAQVRLSQIGNIIILIAGIGFARLLLRTPEGAADVT